MLCDLPLPRRSPFPARAAASPALRRSTPTRRQEALQAPLSSSYHARPVVASGTAHLPADRRQGGPKRPDVPADAGLDPGSLDTIDEEEGDSDGEGPSGPSGAAGGDLTVAPRANSELLRIAAGKSVLNAGAVMVPRAQGDREGEEGSAMAAMMQR